MNRGTVLSRNNMVCVGRYNSRRYSYLSTMDISHSSKIDSLPSKFHIDFIIRLSSNNTSIGIWCLEPTTLSTEDKVARTFSALALIFGGLFVLMGMLRNGIVCILLYLISHIISYFSITKRYWHDIILTKSESII